MEKKVGERPESLWHACSQEDWSLQKGHRGEEDLEIYFLKTPVCMYLGESL